MPRPGWRPAAKPDADLEVHPTMHILHLDAGREMRGGQWQVLRLIAGLAAEGIESTLLARQDAPLYLAARREGWRVEPLGLTRAVRELRGHGRGSRARRPHPHHGRAAAGAPAGGSAARGVSGGLALEVRQGAALLSRCRSSSKGC